MKTTANKAGSKAVNQGIRDADAASRILRSNADLRAWGEEQQVLAAAALEAGDNERVAQHGAAASTALAIAMMRKA